MIYHLQKKVIRICGISVFLVFSAIFALIFSIGKNQLNQAMDALTDRISENNGIFPEFEGDGPFPKMGKMPDFMTEETPFATRFFTVCFDEKGNILLAADYLAELFREYGDVGTVLMLYNGSRDAIERGIRADYTEYAQNIMKRSEQLERLHQK